MTVQTLTIAKRRFVLVPEKDFKLLQRRAKLAQVRPEFASDAMRELRKYRRTGKAKRWEQLKGELGL